MRAAFFILMMAPAAWSQDKPQPPTEPPRRDGMQVARDGTFLPSTLTARIGDQRVAGLSLGGYESTPGRGAIFSSWVEGAIFNRVALRAGIEYVSQLGNVRPSAGIRVGILRQENHKIDLGAALVYKNVGFTEATGGEFEMMVLLGRRWGRLGLFGNLVYGQGIDPGERDGEVRLSLLYAVHQRVNVGLDARARIDLGEETAARKKSSLEDDFDFVAGPLVTVAFGPIALLAQVGGTAVLRQERAAGGVLALGGLGAAF
jgi:hypothetical protein